MNDAQTIAELATRTQPTVVTHEGRSFLIVPPGSDALDITDPQDRAQPKRVIQGVTVQTVDSLVDYVARFSNTESVLFADISGNSITALIDYHAAAQEGVVTPEQVGHRASMVLPFSEEWRTWTSISGKLMEQLEFARFLEENACDVAAPSGADLLETVRDLQARRKVDFRKAVRTSSDNENFEFTDNTTATSKNGGVEVPSKFLLKLPVYFGGESVELYAFLRWRLEEGGLKLGIQLHRAEHVRQAVFKQIVNDVAHRTERVAMFGKVA